MAVKGINQTHRAQLGKAHTLSRQRRRAQLPGPPALTARQRHRRTAKHKELRLQQSRRTVPAGSKAFGKAGTRPRAEELSSMCMLSRTF